jgi:hypothetical protein
VRKQYHFWPGEEGLDAWDVDRLIALSRDLRFGRSCFRRSLRWTQNDWYNAGTWQPSVRNIVEHFRLVREADSSHPIILGADGRVMDGMHRIARALLDSKTPIRAVRFEVYPKPDYRSCEPVDLPS